MGGYTKHMLCQGFSIPCYFRQTDSVNARCTGIQGLVPVYPNKYVNDMKADPWPQILNLLGKEGDHVMIDLLIDCGVFLSVTSGHGNYYQISGMYASIEDHYLLLK